MPMLEAEADQLCGAGRYERNPARQDTRAGSYNTSSQLIVQMACPLCVLPVPLVPDGRTIRRSQISSNQTPDTMSIMPVNNRLERIMKEIRRRTRVVGAFPDGQSCLNLAAARLRHIAGTAWSTKCYMNMRPLYQQQLSETGAVA
jgi:transposase-like protein